MSHGMFIKWYILCRSILLVAGVEFQSLEEGEADVESPENSDELLITEGTTHRIYYQKSTGYVVPQSEDADKKRSRELIKCKHANCYWQGYDPLEQEDHERLFHAVADAPQLFERESILEEETFHCKICKESFYNIADLEDHLLGHDEDKQRNIFGVTDPRTTLPPYEDIELDLLIRSPSGKYLYCPLCTSKLYPFNFKRHYEAHLKRGY